MKVTRFIVYVIFVLPRAEYDWEKEHEKLVEILEKKSGDSGKDELESSFGEVRSVAIGGLKSTRPQQRATNRKSPVTDLSRC